MKMKFLLCKLSNENAFLFNITEKKIDMGFFSTVFHFSIDSSYIGQRISYWTLFFFQFMIYMNIAVGFLVTHIFKEFKIVYDI